MNITDNPTPGQPQLQSDDSADLAQPDAAASDGIDRRNFLSCMAWAGTGLLWTMAGGVPTSKLFAAKGGSAAAAPGERGTDSASFRSATAISVLTRLRTRMWRER